MKAILLGGVSLITAVGVYLHGPVGEANVYAMSAGDAYRKLASVKVEPSGTGPFGRLQTTVSGDGGTVVTFTASGSHAHFECTATVAPEGENARVDASCGGSSPSSGAAAGLEMGLRRKAFIELLDSTLTDRLYNPERARGSTAARWPEDVVDHGDFASAVSEAHKMNAEMRNMKEEVDSSAKDWGAEQAGGWGADTPESK